MISTESSDGVLSLVEHTPIGLWAVTPCCVALALETQQRKKRRYHVVSRVLPRVSHTGERITCGWGEYRLCFPMVVAISRRRHQNVHGDDESTPTCLKFPGMNIISTLDSSCEISSRCNAIPDNSVAVVSDGNDTV